MSTTLSADPAKVYALARSAALELEEVAGETRAAHFDPKTGRADDHIEEHVESLEGLAKGLDLIASEALAQVPADPQVAGVEA